MAGKKNRNDRENRILFIRLAGTDDRNALPPATSGAIRLRRRFRRQPDAARSASRKERPALFPPFVHRVRNRKRGHRTDAAYKLQTTRISDSFSPGLRKKVRSLAAIVRRIPIPTRWITTSFRWAKSGFDRFDCPHGAPSDRRGAPLLFNRICPKKTTLYSICISYY